MDSLSVEIKTIRKKLGKTQSAIAKEFGLPQTTWASYETGKATPPIKILKALVEMGCPIKNLSPASLLENENLTKAEVRKRLEMTELTDKEITIPQKDNETDRSILENFERRLTSIEFRLTSIEQALQKRYREEGPISGDNIFVSEPEPEYNVIFFNQLAGGLSIEQHTGIGETRKAPGRLIKTTPEDYTRQLYTGLP